MSQIESDTHNKAALSPKVKGHGQTVTQIPDAPNGNGNGNGSPDNVVTHNWHASESQLNRDHASLETQLERVPETKNGHPSDVTHDRAVIPQILEYYMMRCALIKSIGRLDNQCRALARRFLGWQPSLSEKEREKINKLAAKLVGEVKLGKDLSDPEGEKIREFVQCSIEAQQPLLAMKKKVEKKLKEFVEQLPVWAKINAQRDFRFKGMGQLSVANLVGETGDLSNYSGPAKVWKRLGLAVEENGQGQGKRLDKELALKAGFSPRRRAVAHIIGENFIKQNGEGPYRTLYNKRKETYIAREDIKTLIHAHRMAMRVMEKEIVKDIWILWNKV